MNEEYIGTKAQRHKVTQDLSCAQKADGRPFDRAQSRQPEDRNFEYRLTNNDIRTKN